MRRHLGRLLLACVVVCVAVVGCGESNEVTTEIAPEQMEMLRQMDQPQPMPENLRRIVEQHGGGAAAGQAPQTPQTPQATP